MENAKLKLKTFLKKEAGDGTNCSSCGDLKFLEQFRLWLKVIPNGTPQKTTVTMCQSCADLFEKGT